MENCCPDLSKDVKDLGKEIPAVLVSSGEGCRYLKMRAVFSPIISASCMLELVACLLPYACPELRYERCHVSSSAVSKPSPLPLPSARGPEQLLEKYI